jgi:hypothetical protein
MTVMPGFPYRTTCLNRLSPIAERSSPPLSRPSKVFSRRWDEQRRIGLPRDGTGIQVSSSKQQSLGDAFFYSGAVSEAEVTFPERLGWFVRKDVVEITSG